VPSSGDSELNFLPFKSSYHLVRHSPRKSNVFVDARFWFFPNLINLPKFRLNFAQISPILLRDAAVSTASPAPIRHCGDSNLLKDSRSEFFQFDFHTDHSCWTKVQQFNWLSAGLVIESLRNLGLTLETVVLCCVLGMILNLASLSWVQVDYLSWWSSQSKDVN